MWRDRAAEYNILGYLVFAVAVEMPFIAYREPPPPGGYNYPPGPPLNPPLRCAPTRRTSYLPKLMGWVLWIAHAGGGVLVEMPLWLTSTNNAS